MTSEGEAQKTSEFLRRRKLRLQQVREQSKDIAKKIRLRAKVENLRHVVELDEKKGRDYIQSQEKVVKKLEELYSRGLDNVGSSHKQACRVSQADTCMKKPNLSHLRGREAAAELKRQKQLKLDELKKSLDRKIHAREVANVLSREKSATAANKVSTKPSIIKSSDDEIIKSSVEDFTVDHEINDKDLPTEVVRNDMGTQWDSDLIPPEWEPAVPVLAMPQDDSVKGSVADCDNNVEKQKRPNLFALSDEMPSSLRGGTHKPYDTGPLKLSSTLVSEYIQNRTMRLRESEVTNSSKTLSGDLKNLRQTITRSRPLKPEGSAFSNICHVVEGQMFPVPMWHAETNCQCQSSRMSHRKHCSVRESFANVTHSEIDKIFSSIRPMKPSYTCPVSKKTGPFKPHKCFGHCKLSGNASDAFISGKGTDNSSTKKKSVSMYNHATRDTKDVPRAEGQLVHRDCVCERDAYSLALSETASACNVEKQKKTQDTKSKISVTRQNVEKEYEDTIAFLNSLPKNKNIGPINNAFKDDHRLQAQRENRQRILQQEFKNIERESRRLDSPNHKLKCTLADRSQKRSKSPLDLNIESNFNDRDFQYSWMPVPESDNNLAVHTIPTGVRPGRAAGSVKFSRVDSYHEYRSRHKHTPPTKDTQASDKRTKHHVETVIVDKDDNSSSGLSPSDNTSVENKNTDDNNTRKELIGAERIIIYKILSCKHKKNSKSVKSNAVDVPLDNGQSNDTESENTSKPSSGVVVSQVAERKEHSAPGTANTNPLSCDNLKEGVYEVAANTEDNLESMYYAELDRKESKKSDSSDNRQPGCCTHKTAAGGDNQKSRKKCSSLKCKSHSMESQLNHEPSPGASKKPTAGVAVGPSPEAGFVKLVDDAGKQEGNFYIGATGFLKDNAYEVIIQLRKKDTQKMNPKNVDENDTAFQNETVDARIKDVNDTEKLVAQSEERDQTKEFEKTIQSTVSKTQNPSKESEEHVTPNATSDVSELPPVVRNPQRSTIDADPVTTTNITAADETQRNEKLCLSGSISDDTPLPKVMHDRSVSTSFKERCPLSEPPTKSDPITATSAYTQTTLGSPNPRPVYIHMSSSTSTAYMSPPEMILPTYFRQSHEPCRKVYRSPRNNKKHEERHFIHQERHNKKLARCNYFQNVGTETNLDLLKSDKAINSDRDVVCGTYNIYRKKKESTLSSPVSQMTNNRCSKCKARVDSRMYCKHHSHKSKHQLLASKPSMSMWNTKSSGLHNKKSQTTKRSKLCNKTYLSPIIREYIHKLLSLNRDGIKAIQVLTQDCSSVNTPTSSIINLPTNVTTKISHLPNLYPVSNDFTLEEIKNICKQHEFLNKYICCSDLRSKAKNVNPGKAKLRKSNSKKKILHKVKALNISKKIVIKPSDVSTNTNYSNGTKQQPPSNVKSQGSLTTDHSGSHREITDRTNILTADTNIKVTKTHENICDDYSAGQRSYSENSSPNSYYVRSLGNNIGQQQQPITNSTQTNCTDDGEINFIKQAEDKLQNMEKIADLTEKCTKRLSNLAKVLEEVRKNKSLAYSQISTPDSASDSDRKSDIVCVSDIPHLKLPSNVATSKGSKDDSNIDSSDYESLLSGVPKPGNTYCPEIKLTENMSSNYTTTDLTGDSGPPVATNADCRASNNTKSRNKPPPALLRINLRRPQENIIPHELSTVIEVDSPLSVKFKSQTSATNINQSMKMFVTKKDENGKDERHKKPELILNIDTKSNDDKAKAISTDSSDDSKLQMMDLNQFNEIMLRPFISLQEYAQDYYNGNKTTKRDSISNDNGLTDDISSLHSDGSLPDVVAELLKRKLITEPFRFDTASNVNSTTISSESTLSVLALSRVSKDRNKLKLTENKENVVETSDSLSISSNPDLENAFKRLGMGWASSTLKKTKERLALSSSSNTSSSSLSHIKFKNGTKQDVLLADSVSSVPNLSKNAVLKRHLDTSKNAEQQTSFTNSMTVKEFLTKELAKKITFTDKTERNDTNQEFVSLFETKLPEELKKSSQTLLEEISSGSAPSGNNNRARTSTPVNIFKSVTYHSSSSSNRSNGLFSNADDLSSVKLTSTSMRYQSTSEKDELTMPNCSLKMRKGLSDCSKTDSC